MGGYTDDGRCKRLVDDPINVLVFVVLNVCTKNELFARKSS